MTDPRPGTPEFHREVLEYLCCESDEPMPLPAFFRRDITGVSFSSARREAIRWALDQISPAPDNVHPIGVDRITLEDTDPSQILRANAEDKTIQHCLIVMAHDDGDVDIASTTSDLGNSMMMAQEAITQLLEMWRDNRSQPAPKGTGSVVPLAPKP